MKIKYTYIVSAKIPENLSNLREIAYNYWWSWDRDCKDLFIKIDGNLWNKVHHNPILLLNEVDTYRLVELSNDPQYVSFVNSVYSRLQNYLTTNLYFQKKFPEVKDSIVYFSTEYGIHESFPNYSGGLGILSGDHLKSASDLGLPLVAIGLLYQQGYFQQKINQSGWQTELYSYNDFYSMPLNLVKTNDTPLIITVETPEGNIYNQVWELNAGRVRLFLLDSNIELNKSATIKKLTDQLYGGDRETRILQEMVLGIGGVRVLDSLNITPSAYHINEGHAAFALLERTRLLMHQYSIDFWTAVNLTKAGSVFTTHTPVPAGNEVFKKDLVQKYFSNYVHNLGISFDDLLKLGMIGNIDANEHFSMTILGLRLTNYRNGVSKLHGVVSQKMWANLWSEFPIENVPIGSVTNGIHTLTWLSREFSELFDKYLSPEWREYIDNDGTWQEILNIPNEELWREKQRRRAKLVFFIRNYLAKIQKNYLQPEQILNINTFLNPDALTIGFARRFATYKRATLLFKDIERLKRIVMNPENPVQIIISGKAHPKDTEGKQSIQNIITKIRENGLDKHIVFIENYDMVIARMLVKGCDVWLNNPIRPLEASGTSGMKAGLNGTLNFSVLDGWWDESYDGNNGFSIGDGEESEDYESLAESESKYMYDILENNIVKMFYDRNHNRVPENWVSYMKQSIKTIAGKFSTNRMVKDYTEKYYINAITEYNKLSSNYNAIIEFKAWKDKVISNWNNVVFLDIHTTNLEYLKVGDEIEFNVKVKLSNLIPTDVSVQAVNGYLDSDGNPHLLEYIELNPISNDGDTYHYQAKVKSNRAGKQGITFRILPNNEYLINPEDLYLCKWA